MQHSEAAGPAQSRLLATVAHEIRTPISGVIGMAGLLLDTELTAEQRNYASIIESAGRALLALADQLLAAGKSGHGPPAGETNPFDIAALAESVVELLAPEAHARNIEISCHAGASVPALILGDPLRLRQILVNLCGNAIKFTGKGGVAVSVECRNSSTLCICVCDTGIGMTEEESGRIFGEYVQANAETSRIFGGTGLGLSISRQIAESMGGSITVASRKGVGTAFTVLLPMQSAGAPAAAPRLLARGSATVILAEDNPVNALLARTMLQKSGCHVTHVEHGLAVLKLLQEGARADIILLDMELPELGGLATAQRIRQLEQAAADGRRIPILAVTANLRQQDHAACLAAGMDGYLAKPFDQRQLDAAISDLLRQSPAA